MKKGLLMGIAVIASVATLTGCDTVASKSLKCTRNTESEGFKNTIVETYTFKNNKMIKAEQKSTVKLSGDSKQYFNDYKTSADKAVEEFKKINGASAKVSTNNSTDISVTLTLNANKMNEDDKKTYRMNESIESMNDKLTKEGYTCK